MKNYKGYYIDGVHFTSKEDIDKFLEKQALNAYKTALKIFASRHTMEASIYATEKADYLHDYFGYSWDKLEEIEIEVFKAAA